MATGGWRLVAGLAAVVLAVAACGGSDDEPAGLDEDSPSPDVTEDSSPEPTSEPSEPAETETPETTTAARLIDFELPPGLSFVDVPEVEEDSPEASALRAYLIFEAYFRRALTENDVPDEFASVASPAMVDRLNDHVQQQIDNEGRLAGGLTIAPVVESTTDNTASVSACFDDSESFVEFDDGSHGELTSEDSLSTFVAELENVGAGWQVVSRGRSEYGC